MSLKEKHFKI